jgi:hypothetical protein
MNTRTSPRNQRLYRALGAFKASVSARRLKIVTSTKDGVQTLLCGHTVALPPFWAGRFPRERHCEQCWTASESPESRLETAISQALADPSLTERQRLELVQELYAGDSPESDSERTTP